MALNTDELHPVPVKSTWHHVAMDFIGPLPTTPSGNKLAVVTIVTISVSLICRQSQLSILCCVTNISSPDCFLFTPSLKMHLICIDNHA